MEKTTKSLWADTPFSLIPTPGRSEPVSNLSPPTYIAREMACAHNGMLRALNSIYNQCIHVQAPQDITDLLLYAKFWCEWLHEHHEAEEQFLFPEIERITEVKGLMQANIAQHDAFTPGLKAFHLYTKETSPQLYDGQKLRGIIDSFGPTLTQHLAEEVETLKGLEKYNGTVLKEAFLKFDAELRKGDKVSQRKSAILCPFL